MTKRPSVIIAVGTERRPKLRAVERALTDLRSRFPSFLPGQLLLEPRRVPSGVSSTPTTTGECMEGARTRALGAFELLGQDGRSPALGIGLEGGVVSEEGLVFLESWAYVTDGASGHFGGSGCIPLPPELAEAVLGRGEDLGTAADRAFGRDDVAGGEGTFGVLTGGIVTREEAFVRSILHALAPFYNARVYSRIGEPS